MTCSGFVRGVLVLAAASSVFAAAAGAAVADDQDVIGTWKLSYNPGDGDHTATMTLRKGESGVTGTFVDGERKFNVTDIKFKDGKLTLATRTERNDEPATATFEGKVTADAIAGSADWTYQGMSGTFSFEGKRDAEQPRAQPPSVAAVPGAPSLLLGRYDVAPLGYQIDEFFISGAASSYKLSGEAAPDGQSNAVPARTAPYTTRIVVIRPSDPKNFSGTVVVEWMNVSGGLDVPVDWNMAHREIMRRGHAFVGVSAQKVGIEGGPSLMRAPGAPLKKADPIRYGRLSHPGDAYSFDIFSQAGKLAKDAATSKILGPLVPQRVIAIGESQSAFYLVTYVTAVDPVARVYDGFLIHSRAAAAAPLDGASIFTAGVGPVKAVKLRRDLRVPVMTLITETDLVGGGRMTGYHGARQSDSDKLRVWEIAGTAHADNYGFAGGFIDSGSLPLALLAASFAPTSDVLGSKLAKPMNFGPQHHYVVQAALWQLDRWLRTGEAPPNAAVLKLTEGKPPQLVLDANGLAEGGIRTPWVDAPTARLSGIGNSGGPLAFLVGVGEPFDSTTLKRIYPGGKSEYLKKFEASLDSAIEAGFILPADKQEILGMAAISYRGSD